MPADRAELLALAARAEAGGDRTLSDDVWRAAGWVQGADPPVVVWRNPATLKWNYGERPDLRVSLDAQEELPGRILRSSRVEENARWIEHWCAVVETVGGCVGGAAPTEPLARLAAKLRALAAATPEERG